MFCVRKTKMKVSVSGNITVWIEIEDADGNIIHTQPLSKGEAAGTYTIASERVCASDLSDATTNYNSFATVKKKRPVKMDVFGLAEVNDILEEVY